METTNTGVQVCLVREDHTLIIYEKDAIFFRCTICGEIKSVHMLVDGSHKSLPWMRMCLCSANVPSTGGDTQPLEDPEPAQPLSLVERESPFPRIDYSLMSTD